MRYVAYVVRFGKWIREIVRGEGCGVVVKGVARNLRC